MVKTRTGKKAEPAKPVEKPISKKAEGKKPVATDGPNRRLQLTAAAATCCPDASRRAYQQRLCRASQMKTPKEEEPEPPPEQEKKPKTPPELKDCMEGKDMLAWCRAENRKGYRAVLEGMISKRRFATYCGMDAIVIPVSRAAGR